MWYLKVKAASATPNDRSSRFSQLLFKKSVIKSVILQISQENSYIGVSF